MSINEKFKSAIAAQNHMRIVNLLNSGADIHMEND
jgi:hypothetical protein